MVAAIMMALLATSAAGQEQTSHFASMGIEAYERGEYANAFAWLKPAVYDAQPLDGTLDAWAAVYLARMVYRGESTNQDGPLAGAMFQVAVRESVSRSGDGAAEGKFHRIVGADPCEAVLPERRGEVFALMSGCFLDGITRSEFPLDNGNGVVVDRTGIHTDVGTEHRDTPLPVTGCVHTTLPIVHSRVTVERGVNVSTRHFLQFFTWQSGKKDEHVIRELQWFLVEVSTDSRVVAFERIGQLVDAPYPTLETPAGLVDSVALRPTAGGRVEWVLKASNKRGIVD